MKIAHISKGEIEELIEKEWQSCKEFLKEIAKEQHLSVKRLMTENEIRKPKLSDVIFYCQELACEKWEWDRERMANSAVSAGVATEILKLIESRFKSDVKPIE